ncbi:unnamed protein product [Prunus armeniaca]
MDFPYSLPLLLRKQIKVLKVHYRKYKLLRGRLLVWCLNPLNVVLSSVFIGGVLEGQSRLKKICLVTLKNICMVEPDRGKWVVKSAFGIVKHGGVTPINLGKSLPPP